MLNTTAKLTQYSLLSILIFCNTEMKITEHHKGAGLGGGPVPVGIFMGDLFVGVGVGSVELDPGVTAVGPVLAALSFSISFLLRI